MRVAKQVEMKFRLSKEPKTMADRKAIDVYSGNQT